MPLTTLRDREYHDDETLGKVRSALLDSGVSDLDSFEVIRVLQNAGILFRERRPNNDGSQFDRLHSHVDDFKMLMDELGDLGQIMMREYHFIVEELSPVFEAIRQATNQSTQETIKGS